MIIFSGLYFLISGLYFPDYIVKSIPWCGFLGRNPRVLYRMVVKPLHIFWIKLWLHFLDYIFWFLDYIFRIILWSPYYDLVSSVEIQGFYTGWLWNRFTFSGLNCDYIFWIIFSDFWIIFSGLYSEVHTMTWFPW